MSMTATTTKERPIIMQAHSVRAILAGTKTQTRRVIKPQPFEREGEPGTWMRREGRRGTYAMNHMLEVVTDKATGKSTSREYRVTVAEWLVGKCLHGRAGDRLWIREAWAKGIGGPIYRADWSASHRDCNYPAHPEATWLSESQKVIGADVHRGGWRSPLHMPRWASRLTLEITAVRVQRVQEITHEDAVAEGMLSHPNWEGHRHEGQWESRMLYREGWDKLNASRGFPWSANPWVWAITFKRVEVPTP